MDSNVKAGVGQEPVEEWDI